MGEVLTMAGEPLMKCQDVLTALAEREDLSHVVVVAQRDDGRYVVFYDRQTCSDIVFASQVLAEEAANMVKRAVTVE